MTRTARQIVDLVQALHVTVLLLAVTWLVLFYQKHRFQNGVILGVSLAAVGLYIGSGRRLGIGPYWLEKLLVGIAAAALTVLAQKLCK